MYLSVKKTFSAPQKNRSADACPLEKSSVSQKFFQNIARTSKNVQLDHFNLLQRLRSRVVETTRRIIRHARIATPMLA
jgi:hypothetical protein